MKLAVIIIAMVVLIGASIGATFLVLNMQSDQQQATPPASAAPAAAATSTAAAPATPTAAPPQTAADVGTPVLDGGDAHYLSLDPAFVVNFGGAGSQNRFLQVKIEVMSPTPEGLKAVEKHMPVIRNNLILLFSSQDYETLSTLEGKEKIRTLALGEVQKVLKARTGAASISDLYFTGFVMQ